MGMNWGAFAGAAGQAGLQTYMALSEAQRRDQLLKIAQAEEGRKALEGDRVNRAMQEISDTPPPGAQVYTGSPMESFRSQGAGGDQAALLQRQMEAPFGTQTGGMGQGATESTVAGLRGALGPEAPMPPSKLQTTAGFQSAVAKATAGTSPQAALESAKLMGTASEQQQKDETLSMLKNFNTMRGHVAAFGNQLQSGKISVKEYIEKTNPYYAMVPNAQTFAYRAATDDAPEMVGLRDETSGAVKQWIPVNEATVGQVVTAVDAHLKKALRDSIGSTSLDAWKTVEEMDLKQGTLDVAKAAQKSTAEYQQKHGAYLDKQGALVDEEIRTGKFGEADYRKAQADYWNEAKGREKKLDVEQREAAAEAAKARAAYKANPNDENRRNLNIAESAFLQTQGKGGLLQDEFQRERDWIDKTAEKMMATQDAPVVTKWRSERIAELNAHVGDIEQHRQFTRENDPKLPQEIIDQARKMTSQEWKNNDKGDTVVKVGKFEVKIPLGVASAVKAREAAMGGGAQSPKGPVGAAIEKAKGPGIPTDAELRKQVTAAESPAAKKLSAEFDSKIAAVDAALRAATKKEDQAEVNRLQAQRTALKAAYNKEREALAQ